jgi:small nuclear ribonucleoprotein (snRNP)-like protein
MLDEYVDQKVVIDFAGEYVCLGTLKRYDDHFLELRNADLHDLRDTDTTRENYVAASVATGVKRNRKKVLVSRSEMIAISKLDDVAAD